jgi:hypothetical protein
MAARRFGSIADGLTTIGGATIDSAKRANLTRISKSLDDVAGDLSKLDFAKVLKSTDDVADFGAILKKTDIPTGVRKDLVTQLSKWVKVGGDVPKAAGATVAQAGKAMEAATSFFKRNEKTLLLIGVSAAGLATLMLLTGESDPAKALGGTIGGLAAAAGEGVGAGLSAGIGGAVEGIDKGLGISSFFSKWGLYIGIFCAVLIFFGLFMMLS